MSWGGERKGSGAKQKYNEPTKVMRLPESVVPQVKAFLADWKSEESQACIYQLPLMSSRVSAGFPSPVDDGLEAHIDLNQYLVKHPAATFYARLGEHADSMIGIGIYPGDIIIVDRSLEVRQNAIVLAAVNGEFTLKRYHRKNKKIFLMAENPVYKPIEFREGDEMQIWGVVKHSIRNL